MDTNTKQRNKYIQLIKDNWVYFSLVALFILIGGILLLTQDKGDAIFFFNEHRSPISDSFFIYATMLGEEYVYFLACFIFLFIRFRYALMMPIIGIVVTLVAFLMKSFFAHPRPYRLLCDENLYFLINEIQGIDRYGGFNSFPSGHTMSGFAFYTFLALLLPYKRAWAIIIFTFALLVGISRVYLVHHFLEDVYLGGIVGVFLAMLLYQWQNSWTDNPAHWTNRKIRFPKFK